MEVNPETKMGFGYQHFSKYCILFCVQQRKDTTNDDRMFFNFWVNCVFYNFVQYLSFL